MSPGDRMIWRHVVSNYGHIAHTPVEVVSIGPKRVRVRHRFEGAWLYKLVKPESLLPAEVTQ